MGIEVVKRDGSKEKFSNNKVANAVMKAAAEVGGDNFDTAEGIARIVAKLVEESGMESVSSDRIQQIVEKTLIEEGHAATAKGYILKADDRRRIREMNTSLMKSFEEITFTSPEESDIKRENANIDSSTAMGTMLKYGSEGAKKFNLLYLMSKDIADAHKNGDIHIHDLDFLSLTETCIPSYAKLTLRVLDEKTREYEIMHISAGQLPLLEQVNISDYRVGEAVPVNGTVEVLSSGRFVRVTHITRSRVRGKCLLHIKTPTGYLDVTDEHRVTINDNGIYRDVVARNLHKGDVLCITGKRVEDGKGTLRTYDISGRFSTEKISNTVEVMRSVEKYCKHRGLNIYNAMYNSTGADKVKVTAMQSGIMKMDCDMFKALERDCIVMGVVPIIEFGNMKISGRFDMDYRFGQFVGFLLYANYTVDDELRFGTEKAARKFISIADKVMIKSCMKISKNNKCAVTCDSEMDSLMFRFTNNVRAGEYRRYSVTTNEIFGATDTSEFPAYVYTGCSEFRAGVISALMDCCGSLSKKASPLGIRSFKFKGDPGLCAEIQRLLLYEGITTNMWEDENHEDAALIVRNCEDLGWVRMRSKGNHTGSKVDKYSKLDAGLGVVQDKLKEMEKENLTIVSIEKYRGTELGWVSENSGSMKYDKTNNNDFNRFNGFGFREPGFNDCDSVENFDDGFGFGFGGYESSSDFVYDLTTSDSHFDTDGFRVHNCCQIPLDKLYKGGFNTGHGFLREPGGIRTAGALAAIAIQSNQNDQHKRVM